MPYSSKPPAEFVAPEFVEWFRSVAPYINAFRGRTFVVAFGGEVVADGKFIGLTHDLNLLASLGVRLVLVHGARPQIEQHLARNNIEDRYHQNIRLTDTETMQCVKEAVGRVRVEIEALLSMGLANSPMANADIRVAGGNFITAQPIGVIAGVDLLHTGSVRKVDVTAIRDRLAHNEVVLLSPLGYSPTGEVFNLTLEDVATQTAIALDADKLIFLMDHDGVMDKKGELLRELTVEQANAVLSAKRKLPDDVALFLPCAVHACEAGVARAHLISRHADGAILQELFSDTGIGSMVVETTLNTLRDATINDVGGILQLLQPLEEEGILVRRSRELL
ncbi:MAG: amino-acid N-acetyltransferase, partial [Betaproteobacteria bacterium]|nr:amino-acid N-acetyltransferase [Betaproteobacteria bacterium]